MLHKNNSEQGCLNRNYVYSHLTHVSTSIKRKQEANVEKHWILYRSNILSMLCIIYYKQHQPLTYVTTTEKRLAVVLNRVNITLICANTLLYINICIIIICMNIFPQWILFMVLIHPYSIISHTYLHMGNYSWLIHVYYVPVLV